MNDRLFTLSQSGETDVADRTDVSRTGKGRVPVDLTLHVGDWRTSYAHDLELPIYLDRGGKWSYRKMRHVVWNALRGDAWFYDELLREGLLEEDGNPPIEVLSDGFEHFLNGSANYYLAAMHEYWNNAVAEMREFDSIDELVDYGDLGDFFAQEVGAGTNGDPRFWFTAVVSDTNWGSAPARPRIIGFYATLRDGFPEFDKVREAALASLSDDATSIRRAKASRNPDRFMDRTADLVANRVVRSWERDLGLV